MPCVQSVCLSVCCYQVAFDTLGLAKVSFTEGTCMLDMQINYCIHLRCFILL